MPLLRAVALSVGRPAGWSDGQSLFIGIAHHHQLTLSKQGANHVANLGLFVPNREDLVNTWLQAPGADAVGIRLLRLWV